MDKQLSRFDIILICTIIKRYMDMKIADLSYPITALMSDARETAKLLNTLESMKKDAPDEF